MTTFKVGDIVRFTDFAKNDAFSGAKQRVLDAAGKLDGLFRIDKVYDPVIDQDAGVTLISVDTGKHYGGKGWSTGAPYIEKVEPTEDNWEEHLKKEKEIFFKMHGYEITCFPQKPHKETFTSPKKMNVSPIFSCDISKNPWNR